MAFTFNTIDYPGATYTVANGINDAGQIVGLFCVGFSCHSFLKDGTTFTQLPEVPGATFTEANGINDAGQIVGYFEDVTGGHGFLTADYGTTFTTIDVPGATYTAARGINDTGQIVGHFGDPNFNNHIFLREDATITTIDVSGSTDYADAVGINNAGQIVGLFSDVLANYRGFLTADYGITFTTVDVPGATSITRPSGINDAGQIVGQFENATSVTHGFVTSGTALSPLSAAIIWIGLKNSDDQGTQFDLRAEVYINDTLVSGGITRCITGVTRNPNKAKEVAVPFGSISEGAFKPGDELSLKILTRIGTNSDNTKCPGHANAVGLRLYYDAISRPSRFKAELPPDPPKDFYFHSSGSSDFLNDTAPTATTAKFKDSPSVNFAGGNHWKVVSTWSMTLP
jgi:probable HAF family extracellular repeat protein